jgi:hypothetical protein
MTSAHTSADTDDWLERGTGFGVGGNLVDLVEVAETSRFSGGGWSLWAMAASIFALFGSKMIGARANCFLGSIPMSLPRWPASLLIKGIDLRLSARAQVGPS